MLPTGLLVFVWLLRTVSAFGNFGSCHPGFLDGANVGLGCIYFADVSSGEKSWDDANNFCQPAEGMHLLEIDNSLQWDWVQHHLKVIEDHESQARSWWVAGTDVGRDKNWVWATGCHAVYDNLWAYLYPNGNRHDNCAALLPHLDYQAANINCAEKMYPICQARGYLSADIGTPDQAWFKYKYNMAEEQKTIPFMPGPAKVVGPKAIGPPTGPVGDSPCPEYWLDATTVGLGCLLFPSDHGYNWDEANSYCQTQPGATLLQIDSLAQFEKVQEELIFLGTLESPRTWWTAATDVGNNGEWMWATSCTPTMELLWADGYPLNHKAWENCMVLNPSYNYKGVNVDCETTGDFFHFFSPICQAQPSL